MRPLALGFGAALLELLTTSQDGLFLDHLRAPPIEKFSTPLFKPSRDYSHPIDITYTNGPIYEWVEKNIVEGVSVVGFDIEAPPNVPWKYFRYPGPATVQLATPHAALVVQMFDLNGFPDHRSLPSITRLISNENILKAGVGMNGDAIESARQWSEVMESGFRGRLDISQIREESEKRSGMKSLKSLGQQIIGVELPKSRKIAMSDWSSVPLTTAQLIYCARDAWASAAIMHELAIRDESLFSPGVLLEKHVKGEIDVYEMSNRAAARRETKLKLKALTGKDKITGEHPKLSAEDKLLKKELLDRMYALAPPPPPDLIIGNIVDDSLE